MGLEIIKIITDIMLGSGRTIRGTVQESNNLRTKIVNMLGLLLMTNIMEEEN